MAGSFPVKFTFRAVDRLSKTIDKVNNKFPTMSRNVKRTARDFAVFKRQTEGLRRSLNKTGRSMTGVGRSMGRNLSLPIGLAGVAIGRTAVNFEKSMNRVGALTQTIVRGQVDPAFNSLKKTASELGKTTAFSASQVADGMGFLAQAGFSANEILEAIKPTLDLAAAANLDLAATADIASNIMGGFAIEANEMTRAADVLALTTAKSNTNLEQLGEAMQEAAPVAQKFGASLETTAALAGLLGNVGIQGSKAGTTLKAVFTRLAAPSSKAQGILKGLGITIADSTGKIKDINQILKELAPALGTLPQKGQLAVINELFGLRGIAGASELLAQAMKEGKNPIEAFTETLKNSKGAAEDMANTLLRGAPGALKRFQSAAEGLALTVANAGLLEFIAESAESLTRLAVKLSEVSPGLLRWGTIIAGIVAVMGPFLAGLGFMVSGISKLAPLAFGLMTVFGKLAAAAKVVGVAALGVSAPVWGIVAAVGAAVAAVTRLVMVWDELGAAFGRGGIMDAARVFFGFAPEKKGARAMETGILERQITQTQSANVRVDFNNIPRGTRVQSESGGLPLETNLGFAGGF